MSDGVKSAALILSNDPIFRFDFADGYTGEIIFRYYEGTTLQTQRISVTNGKYNGRSYVTIRRDPYELTDGVEITTSGGTATYDLAIYYHYTATELGSITNLMNALYAYCECAKIYCESDK